jgi:hypothetical protein
MLNEKLISEEEVKWNEAQILLLGLFPSASSSLLLFIWRCNMAT